MLQKMEFGKYFFGKKHGKFVHSEIFVPKISHDKHLDVEVENKKKGRYIAIHK